MKLLVSTCLLGLCARFDGQTIPNEQVLALMEKHTLIPACPEQLGGLPTPRSPCEIRKGRVMSKTGEDQTNTFIRGAEQAYLLLKLTGCEAAVLKLRSPSCGIGRIYDGSFSGRLVDGNGIFAQKLINEGFPVFGEDETGLIE